MLKFKKNIFRSEGIVLDCLPDNIYKIKLKNNRIILAYLSGIMVKNHIKLLKDDLVLVELSYSDLNRGRVVLRK